MINNIYKIQIIDERIGLLNLHVTALQNDIAENPMGDDPDKPTRQSVLDNLFIMIDALETEKNTLSSDIIEEEEK
jgi:hypothetical protein